MIVACAMIIYRGLSDEKQTLMLNIARNVREQSVSMRTIMVKGLVHEYQTLKSDAKFKQLLSKHIGHLRNQVLEAHLVFFQNDLVKITKKRNDIIENLRDDGQFDDTVHLSTIQTDTVDAGEASAPKEAQSVVSKSEKMNAELFKLNQEILSRQRIRRSCTGSAFVTFRSTEAALTFLRCHVTNHNLAGEFKYVEGDENLEKIALNGIFAPEPSDIRWEFVGTTTGTRRLYQLRNYALFILFFFVAAVIGFFSIWTQIIGIVSLLPSVVLTGSDFKRSTQISNVSFNDIQTLISVVSSIFMTLASRILPGLIIAIGEGFPTVSNRDNVTNNYWRLLLVLWTIYCVMPLVALFSFRWIFIAESCPSDWENMTRVVFTFKMLLSFATISIVLDYLAIGIKVERLIKLRKKYQAKRNAAKASGDLDAASQPIPSYLELLPIVLLTEDRSQPFEELFAYSINSVVFIVNFTVSFYYPQCSVVALIYFVLKYYLDKCGFCAGGVVLLGSDVSSGTNSFSCSSPPREGSFMFCSSHMRHLCCIYIFVHPQCHFLSQRRHASPLHFCSPVHFLRPIHHLLHVRSAPNALFQAADNVIGRYIIGILDVGIVQGNFNIYKGTVFVDTAIAFPVLSIVSGFVLFVIGTRAYSLHATPRQ
jgi:hypothetical protein